LQVRGRGLHITSRGLVVRASQAPKIGQTALDSSGKEVGVVLDVFGSVKSPYAVIKPTSGVSKGGLERLVGSDIIMGETYGKGRKGKGVSRVRKHQTRA
jgi:rRNA processing protein Gar1